MSHNLRFLDTAVDPNDRLMLVAAVSMLVLAFLSYVHSTHAAESSFGSPLTWINAHNQQPSLGLAFLKTRKSGSTNFDAILSRYLMKIRCWSHNQSFATVHMAIERGIVDGKLDFEFELNNRPRCPYINFVTFEGKCWDIDKLQALPPRNKRHGSPLSLFTILREPIERIGSQAFYSREVVGCQTISRFIVGMCGRYSVHGYDSYRVTSDRALDSLDACKQMAVNLSNDSRNECSCMFEAHRLAMVELKSNETLWLNWFEHSHRQSSWYHNHYKKNYYLERMFGGIRGSNSTFTAALRCLEGEYAECTNVPNVLYELSAMMRCVKNKHPSPITEDTLPLAKQLLRSHIDFIIMEKYGEYSTAGAIASVLGADQHDIASISVGTHAGASKLASSSSYRDIMPPSVVKYLEAENAWDIEFYNYAVEVFEERAATEGWNHNY